MDFQALLEQHPDAVMEYIVNHGTKLLGKFKCKVCLIHQLRIRMAALAVARLPAALTRLHCRSRRTVRCCR